MRALHERHLSGESTPEDARPLEPISPMSDNQGYNRTPLWGWVLIIAALAMFVGLIVKTLGTAGTP
jgi:hypothetical protein